MRPLNPCTNMSVTILTIEEIDGEFWLTIPEEILTDLGVGPGDELQWIDNGDGSWTLKPVTTDGVDHDHDNEHH